MATLKNVIRKIEKLTGEKVTITSTGRHEVTFKNQTISFRANGRITDEVGATNFYTIKVGLQDDSYSDYYAGTFHSNISQAFDFVNRY